MQCSKCQATIAAGAKFCPKCGAPAAAPPVETSVKRCPQCGTENPENAKFCKKDGYRFPGVVNKPDTPDTSAARAPVVMPLAEPKLPEGSSKPTSHADGTVSCPKCGTVNSATAKFCKKDGHPLQATGVVTPPKTAPMPPQAPSAIPITKQTEIDADISPSVPPVVPQTTPVKQPAPVVPRPVANTAPSRKTLVKAAAAKPSRVLAIGLAVGLVILASAGGGYAYWVGYVGNRQGNVQDEINAELGSHGLSNVKVTVNREWGASLSGMVLNQVDKDKALALLKGHTELRQLVDTVQIESSTADVEKSLNKALSEAGFSSLPTVQLDQDLMATLHGSADSQEEKDRMLALVKGVAGVKGIRDEIEVTAPEKIPEPENLDMAEMAPQPPAPLPLLPQVNPQRVIDKAALIVGTWADGGPNCAQVIQTNSPDTIQLNLWYCESDVSVAANLLLTNRNGTYFERNGKASVKLVNKNEIRIDLKAGIRDKLGNVYVPERFNPRFTRMKEGPQASGLLRENQPQSQVDRQSKPVAQDRGGQVTNAIRQFFDRELEKTKQCEGKWGTTPECPASSWNE